MSTDLTQDKLLAAATDVFADSGFSGARVDEIAKRAKANKATIYYHFQDKRGLYQAVLFRLLGPVRDHVRSLEALTLEPQERLRRLYAGIIGHFAEQPALPKIMLREVLAGGKHMAPESAGLLAAVLGFVSAALQDGARPGAPRTANPMLFHMSVMGPLLLISAGDGFRERLRAVAPVASARPDAAELLQHVDNVIRWNLGPREEVRTR